MVLLGAPLTCPRKEACWNSALPRALSVESAQCLMMTGDRMEGCLPIPCSLLVLPGSAPTCQGQGGPWVGVYKPSQRYPCPTMSEHRAREHEQAAASTACLSCLCLMKKGTGQRGACPSPAHAPWICTCLWGDTRGFLGGCVGLCRCLCCLSAADRGPAGGEGCAW